MAAYPKRTETCVTSCHCRSLDKLDDAAVVSGVSPGGRVKVREANFCMSCVEISVKLWCVCVCVWIAKRGVPRCLCIAWLRGERERGRVGVVGALELGYSYR